MVFNALFLPSGFVLNSEMFAVPAHWCHLSLIGGLLDNRKDGWIEAAGG